MRPKPNRDLENRRGSFRTGTSRSSKASPGSGAFCLPEPFVLSSVAESVLTAVLGQLSHLEIRKCLELKTGTLKKLCFCPKSASHSRLCLPFGNAKCHGEPSAITPETRKPGVTATTRLKSPHNQITSNNQRTEDRLCLILFMNTASAIERQH